MQNYRALARSIFGHIFGIQALAQVEIHLYGAALPFAANRIFERVFDLRAVKGTIPLGNHKLAARMAQAVHQRLFGLVPEFVRTDARSRTGRDFVQDVGKAKICIHLLKHLGEGVAFSQNLVFGAKNVPIILRKAAHTHDAV